MNLTNITRKGAKMERCNLLTIFVIPVFISGLLKFTNKPNFNPESFNYVSNCLGLTDEFL